MQLNMINLRASTLAKISGYEADILKAYWSGDNANKLGKKYKLHPAVIRKFLRNNDVKIRDHSHANGKYTEDENYFSKINSAIRPICWDLCLPMDIT